MKLATWMRRNGVDDRTLAARLGCDPRTIATMRQGRRYPHARLIRLIVAETGGAVTAREFARVVSAT